MVSFCNRVVFFIYRENQKSNLLNKGVYSKKIFFILFNAEFKCCMPFIFHFSFLADRVAVYRFNYSP